MRITERTKTLGLIVGGSVLGSIVTSVIMMRANTETYNMIEENRKLCEQIDKKIKEHGEKMIEKEELLNSMAQEVNKDLECIHETQSVLNEAFKNVGAQCKQLNADIKVAYKVKADEMSKYMTEIMQKEGLDVVTSIKEQIKTLEAEANSAINELQRKQRGTRKKQQEKVQEAEEKA